MIHTTRYFVCHGQTVIVVAHGGGHHALYAYAHDLPWRGNMRRELLDNGAARRYTIWPHPTPTCSKL